MIHQKIIQTPEERLANLAIDAMKMAKSQATSPNGSASYTNSDGTRTVLGAQNVTGSTMATHVGDTTPPGVPTGVTAWSGDGSVHVSWDGTLEGGIPADFDHVTLYARTGTDAAITLGTLTAAGSVTSSAVVTGATYDVTATSEDDACALDGTPAHNVSPACAAISVEVTDVAKDAATITITSTRGLVFKSNAISTTLVVSVFQPGGNKITDLAGLTAAFGPTARIEWAWQREDEDGWSAILSTDSRLSNDGFALSVSPADVDARTSFEASVVTD